MPNCWKPYKYYEYFQGPHASNCSSKIELQLTSPIRSTVCGKGRRINVTYSVLWFITLVITSRSGLWHSLRKEGFRVSFKAICSFSVRAARLQLECKTPNYLSLVNYNRLTRWQSQVKINTLIASLSCLKWVLPSALVFSAEHLWVACCAAMFPQTPLALGRSLVQQFGSTGTSCSSWTPPRVYPPCLSRSLASPHLHKLLAVWCILCFLGSRSDPSS